MIKGNRADMQQPDSRHRTSGVEIEWDFSRLPCRHEEPPSRFCGSCMIVFGAFLGGPLTWIFIKSIFAGSFEAAMLFLLPFLVIGIGSFLGGLFWFSTRTVTEFDGRTFRYRQLSIFPFFRKAWDEPLTNYEGVLARIEYDPLSDDRSTLYIVELLHPDEERRITLWRRRKYSLLGVSRKECRRQHHAGWKKYSRQLGLPALKQDGGEDSEEYTRRDPEDLDKSVRKLAAGGKLDITFDPAADVPERLELNIRGDQLEVVISNISNHIIWRLIPTTPLVRINRKGIHILRSTPWGKTRENHIRADAVRNVRVDNGSAVVVETDADSHIIGLGLDEDALKWLRDCILSKLADG